VRRATRHGRPPNRARQRGRLAPLTTTVSDAIVSVLTRANAQRPNVLFVLGVALGMGKPLIPIIPPDLESSAIPFELRTRRYLMKGALDDAARGVAEAVKGKAA